MPDVVKITAFDAEYQIVDPGGRIGSKLSHGEPYERRLLVDVHQQHHRGTAFDIGAHVGNHTLYLAAVCGLAVHAWEPFPASRAALECNVALNPGLPPITVHPWAAGAAGGSGSLGRDMVLRTGGEVAVRRIDDHVCVDDLAVIKVDVEGMEADALAGCIGHIERCRPDIYAEAHTEESHESVEAILAPLGYEMTRAIHMGSTMERWQHGD